VGVDLTVDFRPSAHFTALDTWLNDPNGLLFRDGVWHLFFQNNPHGSTWGNMSWGHATSSDLLHWQHQPLAISHEGSEAIFSGSAVVHEGRVAAVYTSAYEGGKQAQSVAWSTDAVTFVKDPSNPVIDRGSTGFRDPKVFRYDGSWRLVAVEADERTLLVHSSDDLREWELLSSFTDEPGEGIWECPDLFPLTLDGQEFWVLLLSVQDARGSRVEHRVGTFDGTTFTGGPAREFEPGPDVYAVATFTDAPDDRRVLIGWMAQPTYAGATPTSPWRGAMTLPRDLSLAASDDGPVLVQRLSPEITSAYAHEADGLAPTCLLECGFDGDAAWEFAAGDDVLRIAVEGPDLVVDRRTSGAVDFHEEFPRQTRVRLPDVQGFQLFLDRCSLELFAGPLTITQLVFPAEPYREVRTTGSATVRIRHAGA
jgi:fructan beta-fructosidase